MRTAELFSAGETTAGESTYIYKELSNESPARHRKKAKKRMKPVISHSPNSDTLSDNADCVNVDNKIVKAKQSKGQCNEVTEGRGGA